MSSARKSHSHCGHRGIFSLFFCHADCTYRQMAVGSMKRTKRPPTGGCRDGLARSPSSSTRWKSDEDSVETRKVLLREVILVVSCVCCVEGLSNPSPPETSSLTRLRAFFLSFVCDLLF